jgi:glycosyltransferase involved in cell wall biosynthesis
LSIWGNDWSVLVPESERTWTPTHRVTICIPTRNPGPGLLRTLRCLGAQTYPSELIEVVVADDGSENPITLPDDLPHPVRVVRQERTLEFGAGQARNRAADAALGEMLFFLDADVIPERQVVESYARWFERCDLAVPMGLCRFVDVDEIDTPRLVELVESGSMARHFENAEVDDQSWRERHFARLDDLQIEALDAFRVTVGATLAVSADQFHAVGGFPVLGVRGVEDTAFGYRVHNNGGVLILDRDAVHWHQGRRNLSMGHRQQINRIRAPYVQSVLPVRGFRRGEPPAHPPVEPSPILRVHVLGAGSDAEATRASVIADPTANVALSEDVVSVAEAARRYDDAFAQVDLPAGVLWSPSATQRLLDLFASKDVGVLRAVYDGDSGLGVVIDIARTRALRRAAQVCPGADPVVGASELFGVWWLDAESLGIVGVRDVAGTSPVDRTSAQADRQHHWHGLLTRRIHIGLWLYKRMRTALRRAAR